MSPPSSGKEFCYYQLHADFLFGSSYPKNGRDMFLLNVGEFSKYHTA
jgi:hypothetical protein